ncbi:MAG: PilZ domain-containing protein [Terriglobales bacterium]|jgi:hypothetical protein
MSAVVPESRSRVVTDFRKPVLTLVEVSWTDAGGTVQTVGARMEDKSVGGARIRVKTPIVVGSRMRVQGRVEHFSGTVRYCRPEGMEYLVGLQRDAMESAIPERPSAPEVPPQKSASRGDAAVSTGVVSTGLVSTVKDSKAIDSTIKDSAVKVSTVKTQSPLKRPESKPSEVRIVEHKAEHKAEHKVEQIVGQKVGQKIEPKLESTAIVLIASSTSAPVQSDSMRSRPRDFDALQQVEPPVDLPVELRTEVPPEQPPEQAGKKRKHMLSKWLELPWREKQEGLSVSGPENGEASSHGNSSGKSEKENLMSQSTPPTPKAPVRSAREVPSFQVDLSTMEDIYRAAGIMDPRKGYSINKVVEMLHSEHIRGLSKEMKRAAVLMALDIAGVQVEQVQRDAKARQDALDAHEAEQTKRVEAEWARKADEVTQIKAELESIKAHYTARIGINMEGVAKEKAIFAGWITQKQQECQSMAEAVEMCLKAPVTVTEPANAPASDVSAVKASAKTV